MKKVLCQICNKRTYTDIHHKDENHKNNKPNNLQFICGICHNEIHGLSFRGTELKKIVMYLNSSQKARVAMQNIIRGFERISLNVPNGISKEYNNFLKYEKKYREDIKKYFIKNPSENYKWLVSIKGIADTLAGKLLSEIDFGNTPSEASLWKYAGLSPEDKKRKRTKANWNHLLKSYCFSVADCFIKQRTPKYREIYDKEKEKQLQRDITLIHAHNRALRKMIKVFLRDLFVVSRREMTASTLS